VKRGRASATGKQHQNKGLRHIFIMVKALSRESARGMGSVQTLSSVLLWRVFSDLHGTIRRAKVQTKGTVL
jgi:hypothetical protein